jgi:hypothetical protein
MAAFLQDRQTWVRGIGVKISPMDVEKNPYGEPWAEGGADSKKNSNIRQRSSGGRVSLAISFSRGREARGGMRAISRLWIA